jgi:hypothetical protein
MSDDRKKPLWPWIVALVIGLPVMYVLSSGPARMVACRRSSSTRGTPADMSVVIDKWWITLYAPLSWASENPEQPCAKILIWYWWKFPIRKGNYST